MIFTSVRRYAAALVGCAAVAAVPLVADAANFAGAWSVVGVMGRVSNTAPTCVFRQVGNRVAGTCKGPAGIGSAAGVVSGNAIKWQWNRIATQRIQVNGVVIYTGVWGPNGLRGTWTDSAHPGLVGTFAARKV
jgi:hypothetical protein